MNLRELDLDCEETTSDVERAAILLDQLPSGARIRIKDDPDSSWSVEANLLRLVEYDLRCILYGLNKAKGDKPTPIEMPKERADRAAKADKAEAVRDEVDKALQGILPWFRNESRTIE